MYKSLIENKKAVLFDLDGTIIDTEPLWEEALKRVFENNNGDLAYEDELDIQHGVNSIVKWAGIINNGYITTQKTADQLTDETHTIFEDLLKKSTLTARDGFWQLAGYLKTEKGFKLGLTTNTGRELAEKELRKIGVSETFDVKVFGDDVKHPKPDPEMYKKAAKELGVSPKQCLVFEDSVAGATSAHKAGMDLIIIWDGVTRQGSYPEPKMFLRDFDGLSDNLDQTFPEAFKDWQNRVLNRQTQPSSH